MKLKDLKGDFNARCVNNSLFIYENRDAIIREAKSKMAEYGDFEARVVGDTLQFGDTNNFVRLPGPNWTRERKGKLTFRSQDYVFSYENALGVIVTSYGKKPKASELTENGFIAECYDGTVLSFTLSPFNA